MSGRSITLDYMNAVRVPWSSASFLAYLGGITIVASALAMLSVQSDEHAALGLVVWAALIVVVLSVFALAASSTGHDLTAGLFAVSAVGTFAIFAGALFDWFGWLPDMSEDEVFFTGFHFWLLVVELLTVLAAGVALSLFRFPLLVFVLAGASWLFVFDLLSNGGDWAAIVTIAIGLVFLLAGITLDRGQSRPFGFWLHVAAGLAIGGGLLWFLHEGDFEWIVIALIGLAYVSLGNAMARSSWVVLGAWGILQTTAHFADKWSDLAAGGLLFFPLFPFVGLSGLDGDYEENPAHEWAGPLVFAVAGLVFIGIALVLARRARPPIREI